MVAIAKPGSTYTRLQPPITGVKIIFNRIFYPSNLPLAPLFPFPIVFVSLAVHPVQLVGPSLQYRNFR